MIFIVASLIPVLPSVITLRLMVQIMNIIILRINEGDLQNVHLII